MRRVLPGFLVAFVGLLAVLVYFNGTAINETLVSPVADRILLILLITVDGSVPFLSVG